MKTKKHKAGRREKIPLNDLKVGKILEVRRPRNEKWTAFYNRVATTAYQRAKRAKRVYQVRGYPGYGYLQIERVK